jgi:DNA mismatch repair protein MutS
MQEHLTPLMVQYFAIKNQYSDALLLFQVGDFYELFFDDAKQAAACLGIALTARGKNKGEPIPLCGVPIHALDYYLVKLVKSGFKVAICDQLEAPVPGKVVERGVTQVLTPGTLTDLKLLDATSASYLFSFFPTSDALGLLFGELLTAQLYATVIPAHLQKMIDTELIRFFPDEILLPTNSLGKSFQPFFRQRGYFTTMLDAQEHESDQAHVVDSWIVNQLENQAVQTIKKQESLWRAVALFHGYVQKNQRAALDTFKSIQFYQPEDFLILDASTQRNLEIVKSLADGSRKNTLCSIMDRSMTPMGSRMIKKWVMRPLVKKDAISARQDAIELFMQDIGVTHKIERILSEIGDIERVIGRIGLSRATLHDYLILAQALSSLPTLVALLKSRKRVALVASIINAIADFSQLHALLTTALNDDNTKPWLIKPLFDQQLDELRDLVEHAQQKILDLESLEQKKTGINSLKIRYNQAHGYYIEVTKANFGLVPSHYIRHQTLVGRERFTTPELRTLQDEIFNAKSHIDMVEKAVFDRVKSVVVSHILALRKLAHAIAHLDALLGFSKNAYENGYVRPQFTNSRDIIIADGRHPVVENSLGSSFIPNSVSLTDQESLWIITGPNMGGKSTFLRQTALLCIMAQCGSFVPAASAQIPILDRIFTRIGAGDNVAEGKSTFLVEMEETAAICMQATRHSLVILDEVGRGTSTFDGLAIAQAVIEYVVSKVQARCLFATHYHELTLLEGQLPGIASYYAANRKTQEGILFLYKMIKGVADGSFGLEVAKLAQLPEPVIARAEQILDALAQKEGNRSNFEVGTNSPSDEGLIKRFEAMAKENKELQTQIVLLNQKIRDEQALLAQFQTLDYENLSPKQAFDLLWTLKKT